MIIKRFFFLFHDAELLNVFAFLLHLFHGITLLCFQVAIGFIPPCYTHHTQQN